VRGHERCLGRIGGCMSHRILTCCVMIFCSLFLAVPGTLGQTAITGALTGTVTDPTGAVVPSANVTLTSVATGQARTEVTGPQGLYKFTLLEPGQYRVKFEAAGFQTVEIPSVTINVTETGTLNQGLTVGSTAQEVTVQSETQAVQTESAVLGSVVESREVSGLPLSTRNYTNLLGLEAGANAGVNNASNLGKGSSDTAVNGAAIGQNDYKMDGVSINSYAGVGTLTEQGSTSGIGIPNPDAIEEFKIQTSQYDAGYGRNPGASVNVVTKSGTNDFHGTAFEFFRNTVLNANDFFIKHSELVAGEPNKQGVLDQNQYGGVVGGPIKKDKLFFFVSYQESGQKNGLSSNGFGSGITLPPIPTGDRTAAGFQAALGAAICPANHPTVPQDKTFGGGVQVACDGSNINPVALNLLRVKNGDGSYYLPGSTNGAYQSGIGYSNPARDTEHQLVTNGDWVLSPKNTLSLKNFWAKEPQLLPFACIGPGCLPGAPANQNYGWDEGVLRLTTILSSNLVNEARFSFQRNTVDGSDNTPVTAASVGITPIDPNIPQLPVFGITGLFTSGGGPIWDETVHTNQFEGADQISWNHGKHTIRAGGEYTRAQWAWTYRSLSRGNLTFQSFPDFLLGESGAQNGSPFSNIFGCTTFCVLPSNPAGTVHGYRVTQGNMFVQDDYKVTRRLTLNLGLRWEYDGLITDNRGALTNVSLAAITNGPLPGNSAATGILNGWLVPSNYTGPVPTGVTRNAHRFPTQSSTPLDNFGPRIGFAWQPFMSSNFVVRGGGGFFYDAVGGNSIVMAVEQSPPYATTIALNGTDNVNATWANPYQVTPVNFIDGFPVRWANLSNPNPPAGVKVGSGLSQTLLIANWDTPITYAYNLSTQYEFTRNWVLEVGYSGAHGIHQLMNQGQNLAALASPVNPVNGVVTTNTVQNAPLRVPYLGFGAGNSLSQSGTTGDYLYNALLVTVRKQFSHGLSFQGAYTYARAFSDTTLTNNPGIIKNSYGLNPAYRPQRLTLNYSWDLPFGHSDGLLGKLRNGWNVSGVTTVQDGTPLTITDTRGGTIFGAVTSRAQYAAGMGPENIATPGDRDARLGGAFGGPGYLSAAAFTAPPSGLNSPLTGCTTSASVCGTLFGDAGIGVILGPGQFNWDIALVKTTTVGGLRESAVLQFRTEFFNAFNHAQFSNPAVNAGAGNLGQITSSSVNPRLIQFGLKYIF
jgi:Carboxypeptidase regulatory-like domain